MAKNKTLTLVMDHDKDTKNARRFTMSRELQDALPDIGFGSVYIPKGNTVVGDADRIFVTVSTTAPASLKDVKLP